MKICYKKTEGVERFPSIENGKADGNRTTTIVAQQLI